MNELYLWLTPVVVIIFLLSSMINIMREYERAVIFTLGRFDGVKGPGFILVIPFIQQLVRVDLRTVVLDVPTQDVISLDNVSVKVNAVIYYRILDPEKAIIAVEKVHDATSQRSEEHTSELQSREKLVCRLLLEK